MRELWKLHGFRRPRSDVSRIPDPRPPAGVDRSASLWVLVTIRVRPPERRRSRLLTEPHSACLRAGAPFRTVGFEEAEQSQTARTGDLDR